MILFALQQAATDGRLGETVLLEAALALGRIGEDSLADVSLLALHAATDALSAVGLAEEARRLAVEVAFAAGA